MQRKCLVCGKTFETNTKKRICSPECKKAREREIQRICRKRRRIEKKTESTRPKKVSLSQIAGFGSLTLDHWIMAAKYLGCSYGQLRAQYSLGRISQKQIINAVNGRIEQLCKEKYLR